MSQYANSVLETCEALSFLRTGLACHALCLLEEAGILKKLRDHVYISYKQIENEKNPPLIRGALSTLVGAQILKLENDKYSFTELGIQVTDDIGVITLPLVGYRKLLEKQYNLLYNPKGWKDSEIDYHSIASSSINFGVHIDPLILDALHVLNPKGTICDLGCGTGEKLARICSQFKVNGIGIEKNKRVFKEALQKSMSERIEIIHEDITKLIGIWEDVEIVMMNQVYHDIIPQEKAILFLKSLPQHFPRFRSLVLIDIVSFSENIQSILPGFDYVHGLQGITPRDYNETIETFTKADFFILKETQVPRMPNIYIWVLVPRVLHS